MSKRCVYETFNISYGSVNILRKIKYKKGWHQIVSGDSVGHCAGVTNMEIDLRLRALGVFVWVGYFFYYQTVMMLRIYAKRQTLTWFVEGKCFVWSFSVLAVAYRCVAWATRKKNRKSFGLFPFSLCSRPPHANDGFQFAFLVCVLRAENGFSDPEYDGMWHAIQPECLLSLDVDGHTGDDLLDMRLLWLLGQSPRSVSYTYLSFRWIRKHKVAWSSMIRNSFSYG